MQFTYHENASAEVLVIDGDLHKYLFKIRRQNTNENLFFRNLNDDYLYTYEILSISRRDTSLKLINKEISIIKPNKYLHIAWCIIDNKEIEKVIPALNEIGVSKITFIQCEYTQKKYKFNYEKIDKLLKNSSSQCGRSNIINIDFCTNIDEFLKNNPNTYMFNFSSNNINSVKSDIDTILIGCEGGFSQDEINKFKKDKIVGCNVNTILKSQTAVISVSSIIMG